MTKHQFETERLILRATNISDADFILELVNTPKWIAYIGDRNVHSTEAAVAYIESRMLPQLERLGYGNYTVIRKTDGTKIGTCGIYDREGLEGVDIGFAFLPPYEKQGYGFEAAQKVKELALNEFNIKKLSAITLKENIDSQNLLIKLGLSFQKMVILPNDDAELMLFDLDIN